MSTPPVGANPLPGKTSQCWPRAIFRGSAGCPNVATTGTQKLVNNLLLRLAICHGKGEPANSRPRPGSVRMIVLRPSVKFRLARRPPRNARSTGIFSAMPSRSAKAQLKVSASGAFQPANAQLTVQNGPPMCQKTPGAAKRAGRFESRAWVLCHE